MSQSDVEAAVERIEADLKALDHRDDACAGDYALLPKKLEQILGSVQDQPELREFVAPYYKRARQAHKRWQGYEQQYRHIAGLLRAGDWVTAIARLDSVLDTFGDKPPNRLRQQREDWQTIVQTVERVRTTASEALESAQTIYDAASRCENLSQITEALSDALKPLARAEHDLDETRALARTAGGVLPQDVMDLGREIAARLEQVRSVRATARSLSAWDGWAKTRELTTFLGSDPTLKALAQEFKEQIAQDIPGLVQQIAIAIECGDSAEALDMLCMAQELAPDNADAAVYSAALQRRRKLEAQLEQLERAYQIQLATSDLTEASASLRRGIEALFNAESVLSTEGRENLLQLLRLQDRDEGLALGKDEHWRAARVILIDLTRQGSESWAARRVAQVATLWARLARAAALQGILAAETELGNYWAAYCAAAAYVRAYPTDTVVIRQLAEAQERLIEQFNGTASQRLERVQAALQQGEVALALDTLARIETEVFEPVARAFPTLLGNVSRINTLRIQIEQHTAAAKRLQSLHLQAETHLQAAKDAFLDGQTEAAQRAIYAVPDLAELSGLMSRFTDLQTRVAQALAERARRRFGEAMTRLRVESRFFDTLEEIEGQCQILRELPGQIDFRLLSDEERRKYEQLLIQVQEQRERLIAGSAWEAQAEESFDSQDYASAVCALEQALAATCQAGKRVALEIRLEQARRLAHKRQEQEELFQEGQEFFYQRDYVQARRVLQRARGLGDAVDGLIDAAWAGELLENARQLWEESKDRRDVLPDLEEALGLVEGNPYAGEIAREARWLEQKWQNMV